MCVSVCPCKKVEARSVEHMKNVARGLENKIIELQQKLTEKVKLIDSGQYSLNKEQLKCCFHCEGLNFSVLVWHCRS